jgi:membrane-associated phospholipid phosphatase
MIAAMESVEGVVGRSRALGGRALRRVTRRADGRAPLWIELAIIAWLFWLYDVVNDLAPLRGLLAITNARGLLSVERSLSLDPELTLNHWLAGHHTLGVVSSYYYFFAHGLVTFAVLGLLWWKRPRLYIRLRTQLVIINLMAFVVFWRYPLAPPRVFPQLGYIDVVALSHAFVSWSSSTLVHDADQLAAMPSLHVAWALWSGLALWQLFRRRLTAVFAVAYPLTTAFVVMATGNHYLFDVLAGAACVPIALLLTLGLERLLKLARRSRFGYGTATVPARPAERPAFKPPVLAASEGTEGAAGSLSARP